MFYRIKLPDHEKAFAEHKRVGQAVMNCDESFGLTEFCKYRRDKAAHGKALGTSALEAFTSLGLILCAGSFVPGNWVPFAIRHRAKSSKRLGERHVNME